MLPLIITLCFFSFVLLAIWKLISKKPDYEFSIQTKSTQELIETLINEINTALSLDKDSLLHKIHPGEPPIDGEIAAMVTFRIAMVTPCMIMFHYKDNGDVLIELERMTSGN